MKRKSAPLSEFALGPARCGEAVRLVGLTPDGAIPLLIERELGRGAVVCLPGVSGTGPFDALSAVQRRLRRETGLDTEELVVMSRYGIPTGERGRATILLAPRLRAVGPTPQGLECVPLAAVALWLRARRGEGVRVDLMVRVGLLLAERHFSRWARARLRSAASALNGRLARRGAFDAAGYSGRPVA